MEFNLLFMLKRLEKERSKLTDREYNGSIGSLQDQLVEATSRAEVLKKEIFRLKAVESGVSAAIEGVKKLMKENGEDELVEKEKI